MRALVLRVAAIMAAVVIGCSLVFAAVSLPPRAAADRFPHFLLKAGLGAAQRRLDALGPADRPAELERLRSEIELPLALEEAENPQPEPQHRFGPGGARFYLPLDDGGTQLVVGPLDLPAPNRFAVTVGILVSGILVSGAALGVVWPLARRLEAIESAMNALQDGQLDARVSDARMDLVGRLGAGFDRMASALQRRMRDREELLHAVAHELGTPLSRVALHAELLRARLPEDARARVDALRSDLDELDRLTAELVDWVQLDGPRGSGELEVFDAGEAIRREVESVADGRVRCVLTSHLLARGDTRLFRRAVGNLLRNAVEHAHTSIFVGVTAAGDVVSVHVQDDGPGIPVPELERVFEPFARLDPSRSRESGGVGLGLAIVRRAAERHGGRAFARTGADGGAHFVLEWPAAPSDAG
ncbi:MAG: ATP-binding protein [Pseudomonadota bacterium]|nr:ATP-binding protein [Pseudomonadota bacterium]